MKPARLFKYVQILVVLMFISAGSAHGQAYITPFSEAQWAVKSGPFSCELSQQIVGFGHARFIRKTAQGEVLELTGTKLQFGSEPVRITAVPPAWHSDSAQGDLGRVAPSTPLAIRGQQIASITQNLLQGSNVIFTGAELRVGLEARNFSAVFGRYESCVKALVPHTFGQVARTQLHYGVKDETLGPSNKTKLDNIIRYMKADKHVLGIIVDAHADKQPTAEASEDLSKRQAELVASYLGEKGIAVDQITARWHGDKFPLATNTTKDGQARNRRIVLRLENEKSRRALEDKIAARKAAEAAAQQDELTAGATSSNAGPSSEPADLNIKPVAKAVSPTGHSSSRVPAQGAASSSLSDNKPAQKITPAELEKLTEEHRFFTPIKKPDAVTPK